MIHDRRRLDEVLHEIADWPLEKRRELIRQIGAGQGEPEANQIREGLKRIWEAKQGAGKQTQRVGLRRG